jgi:hypothetical protein
MPLVDAVHSDGRRTRMTTRALARAHGWSLANPADVVDTSDKTVADVLDDVGDDPVKAAAALEVEREGKNRTTLINRLAGVVDAAASIESEED